MRSSFLLIGTFLLMPAVAAATPYETLQKDTQTFNALLDQDQSDETWQQSQLIDGSGSDLFAVDATGSTVVASPRAQSPFVTFLENGKTTEFKDVQRSAWFGPYVRDVAERGIVSGYRDAADRPLGEFRPANDVSIAELAKMAARAAGIQETLCTNTVKNPMATDWSRPFIGCAEQKYWSVYSDGLVDLHRPATRGEVVATILQAFSIRYLDHAVDASLFRDVKTDTPYAAAIQKAVADGIVSGYANADGSKTGLFGPANDINRAEVAKILSLALQKYAR